MQNQRVIVTGVSRGLGKDLLHIILQKNSEYEVIGTVRSADEETQQKLRKQYPKNKITIMQLDIYNTQSIKNFVHKLKEINFTFDCLINNAAYGCDYGTEIPSLETADKTLKTNFIGTVTLTHKLLPLLRDNGRIINVSSKLGGLKYQSKQVQEIYSDENISIEWMLQEAYQYIEDCKKHTTGKYSMSAYGTSKMMLNAWSRFVLKKMLKLNQMVVCMTPGHCKTDMGREHATRTSQQGAMLIYSHIQGVYSSSLFYRLGQGVDFMNCE